MNCSNCDEALKPDCFECVKQLRAENEDLKAKLKERHEYIQNGMVDMALTKWRIAETENKKLKTLLNEVLCEVAVSCTLKYSIKQALKESRDE